MRHGHGRLIDDGRAPSRQQRQHRFGLRAFAVAAALGAASLFTASVAAAQAFPGGGGGPFASGSIVSVSGSTIDLQSTNPQTNEQTDVAVTLTDTTAYQKIQATTADAVAVGDCVRVNGKGSATKGIKASTVAITGSDADSCNQGPGGFGNFPGAGQGGITPPNGGSLPDLPNGARRPNGQRPRNVGVAFGTVKSVADGNFVVKATTLAGRPSQGSTPKLKTKNVTVTVLSSTTFSETVSATAADAAVGLCASAVGSGDSQAITADSVTISQPENGECTGFGGFGGGGFPGGPGGPGGFGGDGAGGGGTGSVGSSS